VFRPCCRSEGDRKGGLVLRQGGQKGKKRRPGKRGGRKNNTNRGQPTASKGKEIKGEKEN